MEEVLNEQFTLSTYLDADGSTGTTLIRRMLTVILHRFSFDIKGLVLAIETPNGAEQMDVLRFSTHGLSLAKSHVSSSLDASNDLASSSTSSQPTITKQFFITGPTRLELFSLPRSEIVPHLHASALGSQDHPAIIDIEDALAVDIDYTMQTDLTINFQTKINSLCAGLHHSQLPMLANILKAYKNTIDGAERTKSPLPSHTKRLSMSTNPLAASSASTSPKVGPRLSFSRYSDASHFLRHDDADELQRSVAQLSSSVAPLSFELPPPPPSTLLHFQIEVENVDFCYIPSGMSASLHCPFLTAVDLANPEFTQQSFVKSSVKRLSIHSSPDAQTIDVGEVLLLECAFVSEAHWPYLPEFTRSYVPQGGYYRHTVLSLRPTSEEASNGLSIMSKRNEGLGIVIGSLEAALPLALPKLYAASISNVNNAFASEEDLSAASKLDAAAGSQGSRDDTLFTQSKVDLVQSVTGHNPAQQLLLDSLLLGESFVFESGSYTLTSVRIGSASIVFEIPFHGDIRFEAVSLLRPERLRLEINEVNAELSVLEEDPFAPSTRTSESSFSVPLGTEEAPADSVQPHRVLTAMFDKITLVAERKWQLNSAAKLESTLIAIIEGCTADSMAPRNENLRMEWRDYGVDLVSKHLPNPLFEKPSASNAASSAEEFDLEAASRANLERARISRPLAARVPFSTKFRGGPHRETKDIKDRQKGALSRLDFSTLAASPSELSIVVTVHMTTLHVSPVSYSLLMDTYDAYARVSMPEGGYAINNVRTLYGHFSPYLVDFRSTHATAQLYTEREPSSMEKRRTEEGPPAPSIDANIESLRILQTSRFLQTDRSFFYATAQVADITDEHSTGLLESKRLAKNELHKVVSFIYSNRATSRDLNTGVTKSDTDMLVDLRDCVISWGFAEKWPWRIMRVFQRQASEFSAPTDSQIDVAALAQGEAVEPCPYNLIVNLRKSSVALWGDSSDASPLFSSSSSPDLAPSAPLGDQASSAPDGSAGPKPRLVASPQLVLLPHFMHLVIDINSWLISASWDRVDLFATIDRFLVRQEARFASSPQKHHGIKDPKLFWALRRHLPAGAIGEGSLRYATQNAHFTLDFGLELITTPSQLVCLQMLYNAYAAAWFTPTTPPLADNEAIDPLGDSADPEERILPPYELPSFPWNRKRSREPTVRMNSATTTTSVVSEDWIPKTAPGAPLTMEVYIKPADIAWRLRHEPQEEEVELDKSKFETIDFAFSSLEMQYVVDENECSLLELTIRSISATSQLKSERDWTFLEFDTNAGQSSLSSWYFSRRSDTKGCESTAPISKRFGRPSSSKSDSDTLRSFLHDDDGSSSNPQSPSLSRASSSSVIRNAVETPAKVDSLRFEMPRMSLHLHLKNFLFIHSYYREYQLGAWEFGLTDSGIEDVNALPVDAIPSHSSATSTSGPYFKTVFIGNLHLKVHLPTMADTYIQFPHVFLKDVVGWSTLSSELWSIYEPGTRGVLSQLVTALPGLRLVKTVGYGLVRLVTVPIEEASHGRSAAKGLITALGQGLFNMASEVTSLGCTIVSAASYLTSFVSPSSSAPSTSTSDPASPGEEDAQATKQDVYVPYAEDIRGAAKQSLDAVVGGVSDAKRQVVGAYEQYMSEDGTLSGLALNSARAAPNAVLMPLNGVLVGAGGLLHGASRQLAARHDERPHQPEAPLDVRLRSSEQIKDSTRRSRSDSQ